MGLAQSALCDSTRSKIEKELAFLGNAKNLAFDQINKVKGLAQSATSLSSVPKPEFPEIDSADKMVGEAQGMLERCLGLQLQFPSLRDVFNYLDPRDYLKKKLKDAFAGLMPDISIDLTLDLGFEFGDLGDTFEGMDLGLHLNFLDLAINCLATVCGEDADEFISKANGLVDDLGVDEFGNLDKERLLSGVSDTLKSRVSEMVDYKKLAKDQIKNAVKNIY